VSGTAELGALRQKDAQIWARHPRDFYVEPEWCSQRLFEEEEFPRGCVISDPACGLGRILQSAHNAGHLVYGADIVSRSEWCDAEEDFLLSTEAPWSIVSNPPFGIADAFTKHALKLVRHEVALLLPTKWMNSAKRGAWLETTPLRRVWLLGPRPSMPPGPVIEAGIAPGNGTVDFAWFVWERGYEGRPELRWLRRGRG
jgi:hypothetical protein